jgi:4-amino-4-deoxy-L-arabinose transferase-like glycosyltransferase
VQITKENRWGIIAILAILAFHAALNLPFISSFPPVDNLGDESWMIAMSHEMLKSGRPVVPMAAGTPLADSFSIFIYWLYLGILSASIALFGPTFFAGRILSFIMSLAVLYVTYSFGRKLRGRQVGLASALMLSSTIVFSWHSRETRADMMLTFVIVLSIYFLYLALMEGKSRFLFITGLLATLIVQVHAHGAIFAFSILIAYLVLNRKNLYSRDTIRIFSGMALGLILWIGFNYLPSDKENFANVFSDYSSPVLSGDFVHVIYKGILRALSVFSYEQLDLISYKYHSILRAEVAYIPLALILAGLAVGPSRKVICFLWTFIFLPLFISIFLTGSWNWFHYLVFLPLVSISLAISILNLTDFLKRTNHRTLIFSICVALIALLGLYDISVNNMRMRQYSYGNIKKSIERIPEGATVLGSPLYYFSFSERDNRFITYLFMVEGCPDFRETIRKLDVDYIIYDDRFRMFSDLWCSDEGYQRQIESFLSKEFLSKDAAFERLLYFEYPHEWAAYRLQKNAPLYRVPR